MAPGPREACACPRPGAFSRHTNPKAQIVNMLSQDRWLLPEGIEEVLPAEARRLEDLRRKVLDMFAVWGYQQVIPPFIEYIESLLTGTGHALDLQTFKLIDQMSGRLLGLRADMTPQVARIDARNAQQGVPARLCYLGTVLHTQSDHLERSRSPMQVGAELYGHDGAASDLEIIRLMLEMFHVAGIAHVYLDLGHVGVYRGLVRQAGLDDQQESDLFDILQRKAYPELDEFLGATSVPEGCAAMLGALIDLNGGLEVLRAARERLAAAEPEVHCALDNLELIAASLAQAFPELPIHFDLAELRGYQYQTGVVFAAFVEGYGREVARGGRYDEIGKVFGKARPATGFSADLKILARLGQIADEPLEPVFAPAVDDPALAEAVRELRSKGQIVIQELVGQQVDAAALGCRYRLQRGPRGWDRVALDA